MRIQVYVSDELGEWIGTQAVKERRSVSEWVALLLEDRRQAPVVDVRASGGNLEPHPRASVKKQRPVLAPKGACPHPDLGEKRPTSFGFARDCKVCGEVVKV